MKRRVPEFGTRPKGKAKVSEQLVVNSEQWVGKMCLNATNRSLLNVVSPGS